MGDWKSNWEAFKHDLEGLPFTIHSESIDPPVAAENLAAIESQFGSLPPLFREFLTGLAGGIRFAWELDDDALVSLSDNAEPINGGSFAFGASELTDLNWPLKPDVDLDHYDRDVHPANMFSFAVVPNGDQFAVAMEGPHRDSIHYLSHDLDDVHLHRVGSDLRSFLTEYARLGFAGPEYWIWEQFTNDRSGGIHAGSLGGSKFLQLLRSGTRDVKSEVVAARTGERMRKYDFERRVIPRADALWKYKSYRLFVDLMGEYEDLWTRTLRAKVAYARKKSGDRTPSKSGEGHQ